MSPIEQTYILICRNLLLIRSTRGHCQNQRRRRSRRSLASSQRRARKPFARSDWRLMHAQNRPGLKLTFNRSWTCSSPSGSCRRGLSEDILKKHVEHYACVSGNSSWFQNVLEQTNVEIGPVETDLLSEIDDEPTVRSEHPEELDAEGNCELVFESMNDMFPALERNGTEIRNN